MQAKCQGTSVVAATGWNRRFEMPIPLPRGRQLATLQDAGNYITKLPKAEHEVPEWQAAMEAPDPGHNSGRPDDVRAGRRHAYGMDRFQELPAHAGSPKRTTGSASPSNSSAIDHGSDGSGTGT